MAKNTKKEAAKVKPAVQKAGGKDNKGIVYFLLAVLCVIFIYLCLGTKFIQDDAYITFRYVLNFIDGNGLVFNAGERVEGYTNFLWLILLIIFSYLKFDIISLSQYLSLAFGVLVLIFTYLISSLITVGVNASLQAKKGRTSSGEQPLYADLLNLVPVVVLVFMGAFNYWSISGMESTMFIAFALMGIFYYLKEKDTDKVNFKFPLFILIASLTRPEGMFLFGLIILHKVFITVKNNWENKGNIFKVLFSKNNLISYAVFVVPTMLYILFRLSYYGYPFPNTYYAKTGFSAVYMNAGLEYLWNFLKAYMLFGIVLILPAFLLKAKESFFEISFLYFTGIIYVLYVVSVGGDVLPLHRFFLPVAPLILILFGKVMTVFYNYLRNNVTSGNPAAAFLVVMVLTCGYAWYNYSNQKDAVERSTQLENGLVDKMKITGNWFKQKQVQKGSNLTVAATTIGAVSYFAGTKVIVVDMLGLTDETVAHNPQTIPEISEGSIGWKERNYNAGYILSRRPDYIYFSTGIKPSAYGERALFTEGEFLKYYFPYYFSIKELQFTDIVYKRKSDSEAQVYKELPPNPEYKKSFINNYTGGMNVSRDKTKQQEAIGLFQSVIKNGPPNFGTPYQFIGELYLQQGNKAEARKNFEKAVEIDDYNVLSHYYLYQLSAENGDTAAANMHIQKIQRYDPELLR
jgi:arabinofuranosyltransferase